MSKDKLVYLMMYEDKNSCTLLYENPLTEKSTREEFSKEIEPLRSMKTDEDYLIYILNHVRLATKSTKFKLSRKLYSSTEDLMIIDDINTDISKIISYHDARDGYIELYINQFISVEKGA